MKSKIVSKNKGFGFSPEFVLDPSQPVTIEFSVDAGLLLQVLASVRNKDHVFLAKDNDGKARSTGKAGSIAQVTFEIQKLLNPRYVSWSIWATNPVPPEQRTGPTSFTVTVVVQQGQQSVTNAIKATISEKVQIIPVIDDGVAIGAPL
ncbi:hypothetical protein AB4Z19_29875 [Pseudoduganella sp. RAF19]|uniref:hypothetical protein n=1 Tax=Pseudoduganella sp. RAF19 TaxID=3233052 RepID=UPI003F944117